MQTSPNLLQRFRNLWFLSSISKADVQANPHAFVVGANKLDTKGMGYIAGMSDEESSFAATISTTKDTKLS